MYRLGFAKSFFILILLTPIIIVLIYHLYTIYQKVPLLKLLIISTKYIISAKEINIKQRKCHTPKNSPYTPSRLIKLNQNKKASTFMGAFLATYKFFSTI